MQPLKTCTLCLALTPLLWTAQTYASDETNCKTFAKEQLQEIKRDYYGALSRDEITLVLEASERSCLAIYSNTDLRPINGEAQVTTNKKVHWWDRISENKKAIPAIKKRQQQGGK
mgnify:CR=1 FL=1|jgi:hypothetical protein